ncbi:DUF1552 domain-containing protein [Corallococcus sp. ZKHCc1 1396]|uniref:DUF1552 domain-containing protein n=1 Tax=Corallococcus soli TaxID=2710757 RepID=A0ABR9PFN0_9BACT|nr:DUF1552 domain-containing protein [Corallococcus soli]MBE4746719.1 DUF1552 domain-containing protein [Corallococcus soli]
MSRLPPLSRRTLLRGLGAMMALPLLEGMRPGVARGASQAPVPRRFVAFYTPCGIHMAKWTPSGEGPDWSLTPTLASLAPVKDDVLVLGGLDNLPGRPDGDGHHAAATSAFLSCVKARKTEGANIRTGISMDQVLANAVGKATRFPSLELGIDPGKGIGNCDSGYACPYANNIAWAGPSTPVPKETQPRAAFERLFADFDPNVTQAELAKRRAYGLSIIDAVRDDAKALQGRLGTTDRRKLDEYFTGVRELELRVNAMAGAGPTCGTAVAPARTEDVREKTKAMLDLIVLAFQCDLTRTCTFMLGNARSQRVYSFLGLSGEHHAYSHHQKAQANYDALAKIDKWEVEQYAYLLQRMKGVQEEGGTLLDHSAVYFSSEIADGNMHEHRNLPILLAGRAGGALAPGRHVRYGGQPLANLYVSLLNMFGVPASTFGDDGTGPLTGLAG